MINSRVDGRSAEALRKVSIEVGLQHNPEGSVLYRAGGTMVLIAASLEDGVPDFRRGTGQGWLTAEYAMHPRCGPARQTRERRRGKIDGRSQEIQRLIGRALRAAIDFRKMGERTLFIDCDVLDADGGTRTACITGGFVAVALAADVLRARGLIGSNLLRGPVGAISCGIVDGRPLLDLQYEEDAAAQVDLNVVATAAGDLIEVQGTAEGAPVAKKQLDEMLDMALTAIPQLAEVQLEALRKAGVEPRRLLQVS